MSFQSPAMISCVKCSHQQMVVVWSSLNVSVNSAAKADFLAGKLNLFECDACGAKATIATPLAYHDMRLKIFARYYPFELVDDLNFLKGYQSDGTCNVSKFENSTLPVPDYMRNAHIVFSMSELIRYVLFREKLVQYHTQGKSTGHVHN